MHMHTTRSDGTTEYDDIANIAKNNGLNAIAITDHDTINPHIDKPLIVKNGIDVINGIELKVEPENIDERIDLLGYGLTPTKRLQNCLDKLQENRIDRAEEIVSNIETKTGVTLNFTADSNSGRPHIARAINDCKELDYNYNEAFDTLISRDSDCYVSRNVPSFEMGLNLLRESCEFISLAHPYRYDNTRAILKLSKQLDGVECIYPYGNISKYKTEGLDELAVDWFDLTLTGGSDAHESKDIGTSGLMKSHYEKFLVESGLEYYSEI